MKNAWRDFHGTQWKEEINLRDFIQNNYTQYDGDESFLVGPTEATDTLWGELQQLQKEERAKNGVLDMETEVVSGLTAYGPGYINDKTKDLEKVVGLQTDKPLKRAFMPYGGIKMAEQACTTYGYQPSEKLHDIFHNYVKTHNDGVFDAYTPEMKRVRHNHHYGSAVRVCDDSLRAVQRILWVYLRHHERHLRIHAPLRAVVYHHRAMFRYGLRKLRRRTATG